MIKTSKPQGHSGTHEDRQGKKLSWGDNGVARIPTEEYKNNLDNIDWSKGKPEKRGFRMKVNGVYVD